MTPERLAEIRTELDAAYASGDHMDPDIVQELLDALTEKEAT